MKTKTNLITVGQLAKELKKYEKKHSDYIVNINIPDGSTLNVMGTGLDRDGDLSIAVDEDADEGYYDVRTLIDELEDWDNATNVYLEGCGMYFTFEVNPQRKLLSADSEEDETVGLDAVAFGKYKEEPTGWFTEEEKRKKAEMAQKEARKERIYSVVLAVMGVGVLCWLIFNVYALFAVTERPIGESILWIAVCVVILVIDGGVLFNSKD